MVQRSFSTTSLEAITCCYPYVFLPLPYNSLFVYYLRLYLLLLLFNNSHQATNIRTVSYIYIVLWLWQDKRCICPAHQVLYCFFADILNAKHDFITWHFSNIYCKSLLVHKTFFVISWSTFYSRSPEVAKYTWDKIPFLNTKPLWNLPWLEFTSSVNCEFMQNLCTLE